MYRKVGRFLCFSPVAIGTFLIGSMFATSAPTRPQNADQPYYLSAVATFSDVEGTEAAINIFSGAVNCGDLSDEPNLKPVIAAWLRGRLFDDEVYCPEILEKAEGPALGNWIRPSLVDVNDDGVMELAVKYGCSPTGNCELRIFERRGAKGHRQIFRSRSGVQIFEKVGKARFGYSDLMTRDHGSCCDGEQVVYRFDGRKYRPISCAHYSYWESILAEEAVDEPRIKARACSQVLDP